MGKKKKNKNTEGQRNWFLIIGSLTAAVASLVFAFLAGRDYFLGSGSKPDQDQDLEPDKDDTDEQAESE